MKTVLRILIILTLITVLCLHFGAAAFAEETITASGTCGDQGDNLLWTLNKDGTLFIKGNGNMEGYNNFNAWAPWYDNRGLVKKIEIENGVTSIGLNAFSGCTNVSSIIIPESISEISWCAFKDCKWIGSIGQIGSDADYQFGWTEIIPKYAFSGLSYLMFAYLPEGIMCIDQYAFYECVNLREVSIPESISSIGDHAFENCKLLRSITIPQNVKNVGISAFKGCNNLTSAGPIGSGTTYQFGWTERIPNHAFSGCTRLSSIEIPESVISIGDFAFWDCYSLTEIHIPKNVISIGLQDFCGCISLVRITVEENNENFCDIEGVLFDKNKETILEYPQSREGSYTIPRTVTTIGEYAFDGCSKLTSIVMQNNIKEIGSFAFDGCSSLLEVSIPESVTMIKDAAFQGCKNLTSVLIPASVREIEIFAFNTLGTIKNIYYRGSENDWTNISIKGGNDPLIKANKHFIIPDLILPSSLTAVDSEAFNGGAFTYVLVPAGVTEIGSGAFAGCPNLHYAEICGTQTEIDDTAFDGVTGLTIIAPTGSKAEIWAAQHSVNFQPAA